MKKRGAIRKGHVSIVSPLTRLEGEIKGESKI